LTHGRRLLDDTTQQLPQNEALHRLRHVPNCGHIILSADPERCAGLIGAFLSEL
jgi:pimeloyl-ACP methyl ester carboxylesterase